MTRQFSSHVRFPLPEVYSYNSCQEQKMARSCTDSHYLLLLVVRSEFFSFHRQVCSIIFSPLRFAMIETFGDVVFLFLCILSIFIFTLLIYEDLLFQIGFHHSDKKQCRQNERKNTTQVVKLGYQCFISWCRSSSQDGRR